MANKYCNLSGYNKISEDYNAINVGFSRVQQDTDKIQSLQGQIDNLVVGASNTTIGVFSVKGQIEGNNNIVGSFAGIEALFIGLKINLTLPIGISLSGPTTLKLNNLAVKYIKMIDESGNKVDPVNLIPNIILALEYDGEDFIIYGAVPISLNEIEDKVTAIENTVNSHLADYAKEPTEFTLDSDETYIRDVKYYKKNGWVCVVGTVNRVDGSGFAVGENVIVLPVGFRTITETAQFVCIANSAGDNAPYETFYFNFYKSHGQLRTRSTTTHKTLRINIIFYAGGGTV